jgi:hypothetical protein
MVRTAQSPEMQPPFMHLVERYEELAENTGVSSGATENGVETSAGC